MGNILPHLLHTFIVPFSIVFFILLLKLPFSSDMIIDAPPDLVTLKRASRNGHSDIIQYSVVCLRHYDDFSILRNRDVASPNLETLIFPLLWGNDRISDIQSIHIQIRPSWTNSD